MIYRSITIQITIKTLIGSHTLPIKRNHRRAAPVTGNARNYLGPLLTSAFGGGAIACRHSVPHSVNLHMKVPPNSMMSPQLNCEVLGTFVLTVTVVNGPIVFEPTCKIIGTRYGRYTASQKRVKPNCYGKGIAYLSFGVLCPPMIGGGASDAAIRTSVCLSHGVGAPP